MENLETRKRGGRRKILAGWEKEGERKGNEEGAERSIEAKRKGKEQAETAVGRRVMEADRASVWGSDKEVCIQMAKDLI